MILAAITATAAPADEAVLRDGRRVSGTAAVGATGRLTFQPAGAAPVLTDRLQRIVFPLARVPPFRAGVVHQLHLTGGQRLSGELLGLDERGARLRLPGSETPVLVPRTALTAVTQPTASLVLLDEDFETLPGPWTLAGSPALTDDAPTSGRHALQLSRAGQTAAWRLPRSLPAGTLGVNVRAPAAAFAGAVAVETEFTSPSGPRKVRIPLAGAGERVDAQAPCPRDEGQSLPRQPGWRRLLLDYGPARLFVTLDDEVLWYSRGQGPGGPLTEVRLRRDGGPEQAPADTAVAFDELVVTRAADPLVHPDTAGSSDDAWLAAGDSLFGRLRRASRRDLAFDGPGGPLPLSWAGVRGVFLAPVPRPPRTTEGEHVRLTLAPAAGRDPDELEGVVTSLTDRDLTLRHPALGELTLPRARLRSLTPRFWGRRLELETGLRHLGEPGALLPGAGPARAEAAEWESRFPLDAGPAEARLLLTVAARRGRTTQTPVILNGTRVAELGQHVGPRAASPVRLSLPVPDGLLRAGVNVLHLYQVPDRDGDRRESCVLGDIALELQPTRRPEP